MRWSDRGDIEDIASGSPSSPAAGDGDDPRLGTWIDLRGGRLLRLMDGELWEGEADTSGIELLIDTLVDIEEDVPVVLVCRPSTDDNVHAARHRETAGRWCSRGS